jgi:hypothetical protein
VEAEAAEILGGEGLKEKLVDGGDVMVLIHSVFASFGSLAEPGLDLVGEVVVGGEEGLFFGMAGLVVGEDEVEGAEDVFEFVVGEAAEVGDEGIEFVAV